MATGLGCRAPFFTTRIGASVVSYEPQDPRAKRGPGQIRNDPRARFKDSYAQFAKHLNQWLRQFPLDGVGPDIGASQDIEDASHPARRELQRLLKRIGDTAGLSDKDADLAKVESLFVERLKEREVELQHLKYEHHDADAKNAQLRNALRASASALQHAATLMPPDIGIDIQEDEYLTQIQELQRQVVDKDHRILELLKGTNSAQTLAARAEKTLQRALGKWAPSAIPVELQRQAFQAWSSQARSGDVHHQKQEAEFKKRLGRSRAALQSKIKGIVGGLAHATIAQEARVALEAWRAVTRQGRFDKEKKKIKEEQVRKTLINWACQFPDTAMPAIFFAWRKLLDVRKEERKAEELRREHMRLAKEEKKKSIASVTLALTADEKKMGPYKMVILRAWQQCMIEARAEKAVKVERLRAEEREKERKSQAQRRFAMLISEGNLPLLHGSFRAWHFKVEAEKEEEKRQKMEQRLSYLQAVFRSWSTLASAGKREKELENEKERLQKEQEGLLREVEDTRRQFSKMRSGLLGMSAQADSDQHSSNLLRQVLGSWRDLLMERRLLESRQEERRKVEQELEERQQKERESLRVRQSMIALSAVSQQMKGEKEVLLPILWSAWRELVQEKQRDENMDITRRLYEEEAKKAQQEAQNLKTEASNMRQRHLHAQQKRQAVFLMSLESRDQTLLLQVAMSAWRECIEDRRKHAVEEMRNKLEGLQNSDSFMKVMKGQHVQGAGAKEPIYSGTPAPKPGLCQRMCRCLPFSSKSGQNKAVSQAPPASRTIEHLGSRTEPPKPATSSGMSGQVVEQPIAGDARPSEPAIQQPGMPVEPAQPASEPPALEELEDGRDGGRGNQAPTSHPVVEQPGARAQPSELPAGDFMPQEPRENEGAEERKLQALRRFEDDGRAIAAPVGEN